MSSPVTFTEEQKEEIQKLVVAGLASLTGRVTELTGKVTELETEQTAQMNRMDKLCEAFEPAVCHALFETAVYEFVRKGFPTGFSIPGVVVELEVAYAVSIICVRLVSNVLKGENKEFEFVKKQKILGSRPDRPTQDDLRRFMLKGLVGAACYIRNADAAALRNFDPGARKVVAHDGAFLNAVFPDTAPGVGSTYADLQANVSQVWGVYEYEATGYATRPAPATAAALTTAIEEAVETVHDEIEAKLGAGSLPAGFDLGQNQTSMNNAV